MTLSTARLALALIFILAPRVLAQAPAPLVRGASDPATIQIEGNRLITADQIRNAIRYDWLCQYQGTPTAALPTYLLTVRTRLQTAYAFAGFPNAQVEASYDEPADRMTISIDEGQRFLAGPIVIEGLEPAVAQRIAGRLSQRRWPAYFSTEIEPNSLTVTSTPAPPEQMLSAIWEPGKPARLDAAFPRLQGIHIRKAFAEEGLLRVSYDLDRRLEGEQATLVIKVTDPGVRLVVGEITVDGLSRSSREAFLNLAQIAPGQPITLDALQALQKRLWNTARLSQHDLRVTPGRTNPAQANLHFTVRELPASPTLDQPPTAAEQALVRLSDWAARLAERDDDVVIRTQASRLSVEAVISSRQGTWLRLRHQDADKPIQDTYSLDPARITHWSPDGAVTRTPLRTAGFYTVLSLLPNRQELEKGSMIAFGVGIGSSQIPNSVRLIVNIAPVSLAEKLHHPDPKERATSTLNDGVLEMRWRDDNLLRCDAATGRILQWDTTAASARTSFSAEPGVLQQRRAAMPDGDRAVEIPPGQAIANLFASGLHYYLVETTATSPDELRIARSGIEKLARAALRQPIEEAIAVFGASSNDFRIPVDPDELFAGGPMSWLGFVLPFIDNVFERGTWPWTVTRQALLTVAGSGKYNNTEIVRLYRGGEIGPIGYATAATLLTHVNPKTASVMAQEGLKHLEVDDLMKDYRVLMSDKGAIGAVSRDLLAGLVTLTDPELDTLARLDPRLENLRPLVVALRTAPPDNPAGALEPALRLIWQSRLRAECQAYLNRIANPPTGGL
jgi:hypothetical protein